MSMNSNPAASMTKSAALASGKFSDRRAGALAASVLLLFSALVGPTIASAQVVIDQPLTPRIEPVAPAPASPAPTPPVPPSAPAPSGSPTPVIAPRATATGANEVVCRRVQTTGSRVRAQRVCRTRSEWQLQAEAAAAAARTMQGRGAPPTQGGN